MLATRERPAASPDPPSFVGFAPSYFCMEWNAENQLTAVKKDGLTIATFAYDPLGRRIEKVAGGITYSYLYDGSDILKETRSDGTVYTYIHGPGIDEPFAREDGLGVRTYYHADGLGSIIRMTDQAGSVIAGTEREYDAWGNLETGASEPGYAFTGREWDPETGLYYYRARYYDPKAGRFISEDPIGLSGGINAYAYVGSQPTGLVDPNGLWSAKAHNMLHENALGKVLSAADLKAIEDQSAYFDRPSVSQADEFSFEHGMRASNQSAAKARASTADYISTMLSAARCTARSGDRATALRIFANAIHTITDRWSPLHRTPDGTPLPWDLAAKIETAAGHGHSPIDVVGGEGTANVTDAIKLATAFEINYACQFAFGNGSYGPIQQFLQGR